MPIDQRAYSLDRLVPPAPLPFVSRSKLRRVLDAVAPPTACPYCNGCVEIVNNSEIYGKEYGDWPFAYMCFTCDAYVSIHNGTDVPMGSLANATLRNWRKKAKHPFTALSKKVGRNAAYATLADRMSIPKAECHFGMFSKEQCEAAIYALASLELFNK